VAGFAGAACWLVLCGELPPAPALPFRACSPAATASSLSLGGFENGSEAASDAHSRGPWLHTRASAESILDAQSAADVPREGEATGETPQFRAILACIDRAPPEERESVADAIARIAEDLSPDALLARLQEDLNAPYTPRRASEK
jgi:hypothetical protein